MTSSIVTERKVRLSNGGYSLIAEPSRWNQDIITVIIKYDGNQYDDAHEESMSIQFKDLLSWAEKVKELGIRTDG